MRSWSSWTAAERLLEAADRIAAAEGMNVGRNGVGRLADTARAIYLTLLDLSEE
jgi:hypothetical protein